MLAVAACYACTMVLFVLANKLTTAASTIFLQATAPLFVLLLSPWLLHERSRRGDVATMAALGVGLLLLVTGLPEASVTAPQPLRGNLLAAMTGLTWGLTILGMRALGRGGAVAVRGAAAGPPAPEANPADPAGEAVRAAFWGNVLAAAAALPWTFPLAATTATDWAVLAFLGLFQIAFAYRLLTRGIGGVPALEASLLLMLEPVLSPVWAWLVHGERPGPRVLGGGFLILAATLLNSWYGARAAGRRPRLSRRWRSRASSRTASASPCRLGGAPKKVAAVRPSRPKRRRVGTALTSPRARTRSEVPRVQRNGRCGSPAKARTPASSGLHRDGDHGGVGRRSAP